MVEALATLARREGSESRHYRVFYSDPVVLGGCPASSTFNAAQTGRLDWSF